MRKIFSLLLLSLIALPANSAPSFDCNKAKTKVEKQICASEALSILDVKIGSQYGELKSHRGVTKAQIAWQKKRDASCEPNDEDREGCLLSLYGFQLAELQLITKTDTPKKLIAVCSDIATSTSYHASLADGLEMACLEGVLKSLGKNKIEYEDWNKLVKDAGDAVDSLDRSINNSLKNCGYCSHPQAHHGTGVEFYQGVINKIYQIETGETIAEPQSLLSDGWRLPVEAKDQHVYADFNGDNLTDDAWVLIRENDDAQEQKMFVFFKQPNNSYQVISSDASCDLIELVKPGKYDSHHEKNKLELKNHAIGVTCLEKSYYILYWDNKKNKFNSFFLSD